MPVPTKSEPYLDWIEPEETPKPSIADTPEPDPWTHLEPLFPVTSLTPDSKCPHNGPIKEGSSFYCVICDKSGKDGTPALPRHIKPLPADLEEEPPAETKPAAPASAATSSSKLRGGLG